MIKPLPLETLIEPENIEKVLSICKPYSTVKDLGLIKIKNIPKFEKLLRQELPYIPCSIRWCQLFMIIYQNPIDASYHYIVRSITIQNTQLSESKLYHNNGFRDVMRFMYQIEWSKHLFSIKNLLGHETFLKFFPKQLLKRC